LLVANHLPAGRADADNVAAAVTLVRLDEQNSVKHIRLPIGSTALRGLAMHRGANICAATHNLARYQVPAVQVEQAWMNGSAMSLVDVKQERLLGTVLLDDPRKGAANPWAIAWTTDGKHLLVTHAGTHELSVIDSDALFRRLSERSTGGLLADLNFLNDIRKRIRLEDNGPRALCVINNTAVVAGFFSDSMSLLNLNPISSIGARRSLSAPPTPASAERRGEQLFNDATLCHQQWQSCASCHPDGRADGLNWDLQNDGLGNPKNTKSLLWSHKTPPAMSSGRRETAEVAVRAGLRHILFAVRPEHEAAAIDAYLANLAPVKLNESERAAVAGSVERGRALYNDPAVGCAACHPAPLYSDLKQYDVGTGKFRGGTEEKFDTPSLIEIWRTSPYLHDGSATSLMELLTKANPKQSHGRTSHLSTNDLNDLCAYLRSL
jgi:mono/diheme cytochrome c family protein